MHNIQARRHQLEIGKRLQVVSAYWNFAGMEAHATFEVYIKRLILPIWEEKSSHIDEKNWLLRWDILASWSMEFSPTTVFCRLSTACIHLLRNNGRADCPSLYSDIWNKALRSYQTTTTALSRRWRQYPIDANGEHDGTCANPPRDPSWKSDFHPACGRIARYTAQLERRRIRTKTGEDSSSVQYTPIRGALQAWMVQR